MNTTFTRRRLLTAAAATFGAPLILPGRVLGLDGAVAPNSKVRLACIGVGGMGTGNLKSFLNDGRVQVVGICDVDSKHREAAAALAKLGAGDLTGDYRAILARKDVDAVMNATPDHWHAVIATAAAAAGKDLYSEKPLGAGIADGRAICRAVEAHKRVLQCGTWRRSGMKTRMACEWVRNGYIGDLKVIEVAVPGSFRVSGGFDGTEPNGTPPPEIDYNMWLGPAPDAPYSPARMHYNFRWITDYAPGYITDWGAHFLDVAQWGAGMDDTSPTEISATGVVRRTKGIYNAPESFRIEYQYANGTRFVMVSSEDTKAWGIRFVGTKGTIFTENDRLETDPVSLRAVRLKDSDVHLFESKNHHTNFIDAVISRGQTAAPAPVAQRAATLCHLGAVSAALGRPVKYDPAAETFGSDAEANALLARPLRGDWKLSV
ncbi:MAG: gfo/Idh/MocA family oxidoreductase [Verrucomicrobiales bacterium]|nr:gfo/Idh/MocA family oxidoreductase [Verrucomicrobiales bacterium]